MPNPNPLKVVALGMYGVALAGSYLYKLNAVSKGDPASIDKADQFIDMGKERISRVLEDFR